MGEAPAAEVLPPQGLWNTAPLPAVPSYETIIANGYELPVGDIFAEAWEHFKANAGLIIGGTVLVAAVAAALSSIPLAGFLMTPLTAGISIVVLRLLAGSKVELAGFFGGFKRWLPLMLVGLVSGALVGIGMVFLLLPGLYLAIAFTWATWLVLDREEDFWPALMVSMRVVNARFGSTFVFLFAIGALNVAGALCLGLGLFVTGPLSVFACGVAYRRIFGLAGGAERLR